VPYLGFDHLVFLAQNMDDALAYWTSALGFLDIHEVILEEAGVHQVFLPLPDGTFVELIAPLGEDSPVRQLLEKKGDGLYVLAMKVADLESAVAMLKVSGADIIGEGTDRVFVQSADEQAAMIQLWPIDRPHRWQQNRIKGKE